MPRPHDFPASTVDRDEGRVRLSVVGDLEAFPDYATRVRESSTYPGVHFRGRIPNAKLWEFLAEVDVVVVPSLWYETAVLVIQEAFAAGVPVIASDLGAMVERVRGGVDGLLVPPGDPVALAAAIGDLLEQPERMAGLRAGIRPVRTIQEQVDDLLPLYGHP